MTNNKSASRAVSLILIALLALAALTSCGAKKTEAAALLVSADTLTVPVGQTVYFAVAAKGDPNSAAKNAEFSFEESPTEPDECVKEKYLGTVEALDLAAAAETEAINLGNGYYLVVDDPIDALTPAQSLGAGVVSFAFQNLAAGEGENGAATVCVYAVEGVKEGSLTRTFTAGDATASITVKVTPAEEPTTAEATTAAEETTAAEGETGAEGETAEGTTAEETTAEETTAEETTAAEATTAGETTAA